MANALEFYGNRKCISLQGSEETQEFVKRFNDTFDALNRRDKNEGIKLNSTDFKVNILYNTQYEFLVLILKLFSL